MHKHVFSIFVKTQTIIRPFPRLHFPVPRFLHFCHFMTFKWYFSKQRKRESRDFSSCLYFGVVGGIGVNYKWCKSKNTYLKKLYINIYQKKYTGGAAVFAKENNSKKFTLRFPSVFYNWSSENIYIVYIYYYTHALLPRSRLTWTANSLVSIWKCPLLINKIQS